MLKTVTVLLNIFVETIHFGWIFLIFIESSKEQLLFVELYISLLSLLINLLAD